MTLVDPVILFNDAQLSVIVPWPSLSPPPRSPSPSPTTSTTDDWISNLIAAGSRSTTYFDETVKFYLVATLGADPDSTRSLTRTQARSFFLHLSLSTSLSYYEAASTRAHPNPPTRAHSALGYSSSASFPLTPKPYPTTSNSTPTADLSTRESILVANKPFLDPDEQEEAESKESKIWTGQTRDGNWIGVWEFEAVLPFIPTSYFEPKLAVTITVSFSDDAKLAKTLSLQDSGSKSNGTGDNEVAERGSEEEDDEGYMDESYDDVNLLSSLGTSEPFHLPFSRLPPSFLPPLSSIPTPSDPLSSHSRRHSRTKSLTVSSSNTTLPGSSDGSPLSSPSPLLRRSILRAFDLKKPIHVSIRTIDCSIPDPSTSDSPSEAEGGGGGGGGMVVLLELVGPREPDQLFEIESINVQATSKSTFGSVVGGIAGRSNDIEVKRATTDGTGGEEEGKTRLGQHDQFNLVYKLSLSPSSQFVQEQQDKLQHSSPNGGLAIASSSREGMSSVPIQVATSPSQRFTARFGTAGDDEGEDHEDEEVDRRRERERERERKKREEMFRRNLEVVVNGRILVRKGKDAETGGYTVDEPDTKPGKEEEEAAEEEEWTSPASQISSTWNYTIDISSFAYRSPPLQAHLLPPISDPSTLQPFARPTSTAAPRIPLLPPSSVRPISASIGAGNERTEIESIAGSKRHTMASLASLSLKSPVLGRKNSFAPLPPHPHQNGRPIPQRNVSARASPLVPLATPGATGGVSGPRRFFSLPPQAQDSVGTPTSATPTYANYFSNLRHSETPPLMNPVSPGVSRNSLPLPAAANQSSEANRRTSWMSGLGIGKGSTGATSGGGTSWDTVPSAGGGGPTRENGLGLGLEGSGSNSPLPPLPPQSSLPPRPSEIDDPHYYQYSQPIENGRILVTVSLVPLRTVKSRRNLRTLSSTASNGAMSNQSDLPPATLPGLTTTLSPPASHHASFNFPPSSSPSSPSSPCSPLPSGSPKLEQTDGTPFPNPFSFSEAERSTLLSSRMPRVGLLDVFLVQLFVVNQTDQVKRFVVGVPPNRPELEERPGGGRGEPRERKPRGEALGVGSRGEGRGTTKGTVESEKEQFATLVPLENDVRIGPLAPNSCASLGIRMLAISPGAHCLEELKLVDLADGSETRLTRPLWVVVE